MAIFYVRKNGSGTHTTIQSAIYAASNGDTIDIGEGVFNENVEMLGKSLTVQGAGKDKTTIQGKLANDVFTGCSYFGGESVVTVPNTSGMIVGKSLSGLTANTRITAINGNQVSVSVATPTTGNLSKTGVSYSAGATSIILPSPSIAVVVGMKVEGPMLSAIVTSYNSTTRVVGLSAATSGPASAATLTFRRSNVNMSITQVSSPSSSSGPASIMVTGTSNGLVIRDLRSIGFDGVVGQEAAALFFTAGTAPGHTNFLVENCHLTADGDSAVMCGSNPHLSNGTFQNCIIDGKTFTGSEPADLPSFSTFVANAVVKSIGASSSVFTFSDMRGIIVGRSFTAASAFAGSGSITAISGNDVTVNKVSTVAVDGSVPCTFTLTAYSVPNAARNLFYVGQNTTPNNTSNITFRNNLVKGQTGAVISATGSKSMFNSAITIESVGGLVENNIIDGNFGAGDPNPLMSNSAIRCRQAGIVVQNNINKTSGGRGNSGFLVALGTSLNNQTVNRALIEVTQPSSSSVQAIMEKSYLKEISKVSSSPVFSDEANWQMVSYVFKHKNSSRRIVSTFKGSFDSTRDVKRKANMISGDQFELVKIIIAKADRTLLVLKRSEISDASSFDFTLS